VASLFVENEPITVIGNSAEQWFTGDAYTTKRLDDSLGEHGGIPFEPGSPTGWAAGDTGWFAASFGKILSPNGPWLYGPFGLIERGRPASKEPHPGGIDTLCRAWVLDCRKRFSICRRTPRPGADRSQRRRGRLRGARSAPARPAPPHPGRLASGPGPARPHPGRPLPALPPPAAAGLRRPAVRRRPGAAAAVLLPRSSQCSSEHARSCSSPDSGSGGMGSTHSHGQYWLCRSVGGAK
jgi:hypothetical protein